MSTLSRLFLNPQRRGARKLLANPQAMHAAVLSCFAAPEEMPQRVLWRVDPSAHRHTLYVVSPTAPDLSALVEQAGWASHPGETADYQPLLDRVLVGSQWRFRLTANPVKSLAGPRGSRGKVIPHVTADQQVEWLMTKAPQHGFTIVEDPAASNVPLARVTGRDNLRFQRRHAEPEKGRNVAVRSASFEGCLQVSDADAMRATMLEGLGRAKAYGCGLITLARI